MKLTRLLPLALIALSPVSHPTASEPRSLSGIVVFPEPAEPEIRVSELWKP